MRYELSDYEWTAIKPMLPNKPRGVRRVNDRRVLNGIFWVLRSGAPWRDLPESYGPYTTCYNRFVRWRQAGIWDQIMEALAAAHDGAVQMIDTSVRACTPAWSLRRGQQRTTHGPVARQLTSKIHAVADANGLPVQLASHPAKLTTIGSAELLTDRSCNQCCWQIGDMTLTGSGRSSVNKARGPIFRRKAIEKSRFVLAHLVSRAQPRSTRSSSVGGSPRATTNLRPTIWPSSNWPLSVSGYALMSPRPSCIVKNTPAAPFNCFPA